MSKSDTFEVDAIHVASGSLEDRIYGTKTDGSEASWHTLSRSEKWDRDPKAAFLELADDVDRLFHSS